MNPDILTENSQMMTHYTVLNSGKWRSSTDPLTSPHAPEDTTVFSSNLFGEMIPGNRLAGKAYRDLPGWKKRKYWIHLVIHAYTLPYTLSSDQLTDMIAYTLVVPPDLKIFRPPKTSIAMKDLREGDVVHLEDGSVPQGESVLDGFVYSLDWVKTTNEHMNQYFIATEHCNHFLNHLLVSDYVHYSVGMNQSLFTH